MADDVLIDIGADVDDAIKGIEKLSKALTSLKGASKGSYSNVDKLANTLTKIGVSTRNVTYSASTLSQLADSITKLKTAQSGFTGKNLNTLATNITKLGAAVNRGRTSFTYVASIASSVAKLKAVAQGGASGWKGLASGLSAVSDAMSIFNAEKVASINSLASALSGFSGIKISKSSFNGLAQLPAIMSSFEGLDVAAFTAQIEKLTTAIAPLIVEIEKLAAACAKLPPEFRNISSAAKSVSSANKTLNKAAASAAKSAQAESTATNAILRSMNRLSSGSKRGASALSKLSSAFNTTSASAKRFSARMRVADKGISTSMVFNVGILATGVLALSKAFATCIDNVNEYIESMNLAATVMGADTFTQAAGTLTGSSFSSDYDVSTGTGSGFWTTAQNVMGIDAGEAIKYQAVFEDIITGMGVARESAAAMSQQLTQLGYDISSFNNISVSDAMQKIQSGISGELEPMRRIGYDLSVARLQQDALTAGIGGTASEMTQAEKVQLRYYEMMTQITESHGDLARTLNSPANQIRILSAQMQILARNIGMLLLPALNAIVPVLTAVVKLLNEAAVNLASFFGVDLSSYLADLSTVDYSSMLDQTDDISDSLDDATESAKALERQLMGFDEINKFNDTSSSTSDDSGDTGLGSIDVDSLGYDFFEGLAASKVNSIIEDIKSTIEGGNWYQVGKDMAQSITHGLNTMIGAWPTIQAAMVEGANNLATALNGALSNRNFSFAIGDNIAQAINTMFQSGLEFVRTLDWNQLGGFVANGFNAAMRNIDFESIVLFYTEGLNGIFEAVSAFLENGQFVALGSSVGSALSEGLLSTDFSLMGITIATSVNSVKDTLAAAFAVLGENVVQGGKNLAQGFNDMFATIEWASIGTTLANGFMTVVNFLGAAITNFDVQSLIDGINDLIQNAIADTDWVAVGYAIGEFVGKAAKAIVEVVFNLNTWLQIAGAIVEALSGAIVGMFNSGGLLDFITLIFPAGKIAEFAGNVFKGVSKPIVDALTGAAKAGNSIVKGGLDTGKSLVESVTNKVWSIIYKIVNKVWDVVNKIFIKFGNGLSGMKSSSKAVLDTVSSFFTKAFSGILKTVKVVVLSIEAIIGNIKGFFKSFINNWIIRPLNKLFGGINSAKNAIAGFLNGFSAITGWTFNTSSSSFQIPLLASGGQLNTGQMFIAREAGPEMVGSMNGKTTVANNDQIVEGIESGVYSAMMQVLPYFVQQQQTSGGDVTLTLQVGNEEIARAVNKGNSSLVRRGAVKPELVFG